MDNSTAAALGEGVGFVLAALPMYLLGLVVGLPFKSKEPKERAAYAAILTWVAVFILTIWSLGFGAGFYYLPAAIVVYFMLKRHYLQLWQPDEDELERTFE
jgi:hypothetical protein